MKKITSTALWLLLLLPLLAFECGGGGKKLQSSGEEDLFLDGGDQKNQGPTPKTYGPPAQATTVISDNENTENTVDRSMDDQMTDSGFTVGEERTIGLISDILERKSVTAWSKTKGKMVKIRNVAGYRDVTDNLINNLAIFDGAKYRVPVDALNFWGRHRFDRTMEPQVVEQMKVVATWKVDHRNDDKGLRRLKLLEEAWNRARPFETRMPN